MTDTIELGRREAAAIRQAVLRTDPQRMLIRKAAVLGAGVMGAQIAAHLANANVQPVLFELAAEGRDKSANARKAIEGLAKLNPAPAATAAVLRQIVPANYDEHLALLAECDLVSIYARVLRVGRTSISVDVEVFAQRKRDGQAQAVKVTEAQLTYVAVDAQRNPRPVPGGTVEV